tara:strand:+ start:661 stop:1080 length:420 start_codon:yes stop_codon:yes gene_type:complete
MVKDLDGREIEENRFYIDGDERVYFIDGLIPLKDDEHGRKIMATVVDYPGERLSGGGNLVDGQLGGLKRASSGEVRAYIERMEGRLEIYRRLLATSDFPGEEWEAARASNQELTDGPGSSYSGPTPARAGNQELTDGPQ